MTFLLSLPPSLVLTKPLNLPHRALTLSTQCPFSTSAHPKKLQFPSQILQHPSSPSLWGWACCHLPRYSSEARARPQRFSVELYFLHLILHFYSLLSSMDFPYRPGPSLTNTRLSDFIFLMLLSQGCWIPKLSNNVQFPSDSMQDDSLNQNSLWFNWDKMQWSHMMVSWHCEGQSLGPLLSEPQGSRFMNISSLLCFEM